MRSMDRMPKNILVRPKLEEYKEKNRYFQSRSLTSGGP